VNGSEISLGKKLIALKKGKAVKHYVSFLDLVDKSVDIIVRNAALRGRAYRKIILYHK
jgi:hypothetical protein